MPSGESNPRGLDIPASTSPRPSSALDGASSTQYGSPSLPQIPLPQSQHQSPVGTPRSVPGQHFLRPNTAGPGPAASSSSSLGGGDQTPVNVDELSEAQKADIVRRHLLSAEEQRTGALESGVQLPKNASFRALQNAGASGVDTNESSISVLDEEYPTPYKSLGGDVVAPIYKWASQQGTAERSAASTPGGPTSAGTPTSLRRSKSLVSLGEQPGSRRASHGAVEGRVVGFMAGVGAGAESDDDDAGSMSAREILEPGGFRRDFVIRRMASRGGASTGEGRFTRSFVDFLSLYGHFGGEDLEEIEEDDGEFDEEDDLDYDASTIRNYGGVTPKATAQHQLPRAGSREVVDSEQSPLIRRTQQRSERAEASRASKPATRKRSSSVGQHGDATVTQAVLMLLKSFVGTGVLFLGKAFLNGGIIFSTIVLCFIAMISLYSFLLLVDTRLTVHGSFGDIGGILYGKYMRWAILFSIVLSQIGFVSAYTIFVAQNLQAFFMAVTNCARYIPIFYLILAQLVIFLPLAMIRNIQKLSGTALIADAFILFGLVYIFSNEIKILADNGLADVKYFNAKDFPLLIGTAVFSFEGIGLVIPITESMKDPHRFPKVLTVVMVGVMILFAGGGALAYAAYGSAIQTVVFVNLPQEDRFVNAAQFLYSIAILLSTPLQLFPAVRIMENGIFSRSGKHSTKVKWEKNLFRMAVVVGCSFIAWAGASDLDKFVSLIGSVACVPLCFCYPALLHYKACAHTRKQKAADIALFVFGLAAAFYTTSQTTPIRNDDTLLDALRDNAVCSPNFNSRSKQHPVISTMRIGFPPKAIEIGAGDAEKLLTEMGISNGETIIVAELEEASPSPVKRVASPPPPPPPVATPSYASIFTPTPARSSDGPEYVSLEEGYLVVPDDNSCLFTSLALLLLPAEPAMSAAVSLRKLVASLLDQPEYQERFSEDILGQSRASYIKAIQGPNTWGGAIELSLLSSHFAVEICSIDVQSGRIDTFGEGSGFEGRVLVIYSGIHYDALTLSPIPPETTSELSFPFDTTQFPTYSSSSLVAAQEVATKLRSKHAYTDAANFTLRCEDCQDGLVGEKDAREHARTTGHVRFGEY